MKINRRWLVLAALVVATAAAAALVAASTGRAGSSGASGSAHRLGRRGPPAGREAVRQDPSEGPPEHRHVRRRRQRRDDDADEDPALEPHRQGLAGHHLHRAGQRSGLDGAEAVRLRTGPQDRLPEEPPRGLARAVAQAVHGQRPPGLPPGQPGPGGALRQQEADEPVRLHRPDDVAGVGGAGRRRSPRSIPATSSATSATPTAPGSTCGPTSARSRRSSRRTPSGSTPATCTAPAWPICSIR